MSEGGKEKSGSVYVAYHSTLSYVRIGPSKFRTQHMGNFQLRVHRQPATEKQTRHKCARPQEDQAGWFWRWGNRTS